jgi:hypothetical protein
MMNLIVGSFLPSKDLNEPNYAALLWITRWNSVEKTAKTKLLGNSRRRGIVAKPVRIGLGNFAYQAMMAK